MRGRGQLCRSRKRRLWRPIRPFKFLACAAWNLCVYLASLWRLQRLQRYRARKRSIAGLPFYGQFPPALPRQSSSGFLAPLAHQLEHLASRLLVHSTRRKRRWPMENLPKPLHYHGSRWSLAWRKLDVCHLRRHPRGRLGRGALLLSSQIGRRGYPANTHRILLPLDSANSDFQCSLLESGLLQGDLAHFSGGTPGWTIPFRLAV